MAVRVKNTNDPSGREGWLLLTGAALILLFLFFKLYQANTPPLERASNALREGHALKLHGLVNKDVLRKIIADGNYYSDPRDVQLLTDSLAGKLLTNGAPENLGALNKNNWSIMAPLPWKSPIGGIDFQDRLMASRQRLGFDSVLYVQELSHPAKYPSTFSLSTGNRSISGRVTNSGKPMAGMLVQLRDHIPTNEEDSLSNVIGYARTNAAGEFSFIGLMSDSGYSVLPMKPGFEFGNRQGTSRLSRDLSFHFTAKPHRIRLTGSITYAQIKEDGMLMVRTPEEYTTRYELIAVALVLSFFVVNLFLALRKVRTDPFLLPILLLLCGVSILLLFSIQDPLTDTLLAFQTLQGVLAGLIFYTLFAQINIGKFYTRWWFDGLFNIKQKNIYGLKGWSWLALALLMALVTVLIGTGPEGSGVKVNIQLPGFTFQPSEITKYLLLFFLAAFFAANGEKIRQLADIRWRMYLSVGMFAGIGIILALYLLMGDMGPAMVVCFTFLFFYSIVRGNLLLTLSAASIYCVLLWLAPGWMATMAAFLFALIVLLLQGQGRSSKWYGAFATIADAPVLVLVVIAAFAFWDRVPGIGSRLADRKAMWLSQWNNDVFGGDHLAHSFWTLSSGGFTGQGIGRGFPNTMPAAHTDMILPSIGEDLGWLGLVAVLLLFGILIHRIFLHGRRSGQPFTFYLCAGIALALGVQLLLIAGGSIGLLPLTGVAVPFLSYGKISLIINLAAIGIVAGISARPGQDVQQEHVSRHYDALLATGIDRKSVV